MHRGGRGGGCMCGGCIEGEGRGCIEWGGGA